MIAIAAVAFLASCGNNTESTTTTNDSTVVSTDTVKVDTANCQGCDTLTSTKTAVEEKK
jgi:hypothetical protein